MSAPCPACGRPTTTAMHLDRWDLARCDGCGLGFLDPAPSDDDLAAAYAADYYGGDGAKFRFPLEQVMRRFARRDAKAIADALPAGAGSVVDVGCGRGVLANALVERGVAVTGVERDNGATRGIDGRVNVVVAPALAEAQLPPKSFGAVVFRHVLEHLRDPVSALRAAGELVVDGGVVVVEVPAFDSLASKLTGDAWFHLDPPRHLFHFSADSLLRMCRLAGLEGKLVRRASLSQDAMGWLQSALTRAGRSRQGFFDALKAGGSVGVVDAVAGVALGPAAVVAAVAEAVAGGGGVLVVEARKR